MTKPVHGNSSADIPGCAGTVMNACGMDCGETSSVTTYSDAGPDAGHSAADTSDSPDTGADDGLFLTNALAFAYIGDAVFELMVRDYMFRNGSHQAERLHRHTTAIVNAAAQSDMARLLIGELDERELAIYRRGRNASTVTAARHQKITDYRRATGLEAVFGYLYLEGEEKRLRELFARGMELYLSGSGQN